MAVLTYLNPDVIEDGSISSSKINGVVTSVKVDNSSKTPSTGVVDLGYINKHVVTYSPSSVSITIFPCCILSQEMKLIRWRPALKRG